MFLTTVAIRYDRGSTIETLKPHITEDGTLLAEAVFARDGVLEYRDAATGKVRREFRSPEENQRALTGFGLLPITNEHPSGLLTEDNAGDHRKGITLQNVEHVTSRKGGFVRGSIAVFDSELKGQILRGERVETSTGYRCDLEEKPGVYVAPDGSRHRFDASQINVQPNHQAVTVAGRAGEDVRVHTDSTESDVAYQTDSIDPKALIQDSTKPKEQRKRMATLRIDSAEYPDIPEAVASVVSSKLSQLDELKSGQEKKDTKLAELTEAQTRESARADAAQTRADAAEYVLGNAEEILESLGYKRDNDGEYHLDSPVAAVKKGKKAMKESDMDDDEETDKDGEEMAEDDGKKMMMPWMKKGKEKMKSMKKDSTRIDARTLISAWKEADKLVPAVNGVSFMDQHFDSVEEGENAIAHIKALVVQSLKPKFKLDSMSADQVEVAYSFIKADAAEAEDKEEEEEGEEDRNDSAINYTTGSRAATAAARANAGNSYAKPDQNQQPVVATYEQPLSLSRAN